jgi:hypothetical protein
MDKEETARRIRELEGTHWSDVNTALDRSAAHQARTKRLEADGERGGEIYGTERLRQVHAQGHALRSDVETDRSDRADRHAQARADQARSNASGKLLMDAYHKMDREFCRRNQSLIRWAGEHGLIITEPLPEEAPETYDEDE